MSEYVVELKNITKRFPGVVALHNMQLAVKPGEIHGLIGENGAGKSTLIKVLTGVHMADEGEIYVNGEKRVFKNPNESAAAGIACVYQELNIEKLLSVTDNIFINKWLKKGALLDYDAMHKKAEEVMKSLGQDVDPRKAAGTLGMGVQQMIEIAKAVLIDAKMIIMDEPTSSLGEKEVEQLMKTCRELKDRGIGILFVSHKLEELFELCDRVTVIRDGEYIGTDRAANLNVDKVVEMMVGRQVGNMFPKVDCEIGDVILEVKDLASGKSFEHVSFQVHRGEIFGFAGLVGAGRTEIVETIFGMRKKTAGQIFLNGKEVNIKSPEDAIANSIGLLTEDRRGNGIFGLLDITENTVMASLKNYGFPQNHKKMETDAIKWNQAMRTKTPSMRQRIMNLSGGNQQKVLLARWLLLNPDILIVDEPTRGIDVGAKSEIHSIITQLAGEGKAIIMISSELPEVSGMADRILVMYEGHMMGIIDRNRDGGDPYDSQELLTYAHGEKNDFATAK